MKVRLARIVRLSIPLFGGPEAWKGSNTFAGWPSPAGFGLFTEFRVICIGETDPSIGYLVNISEIDRAVRTAALPFLAQVVQTSPRTHPAAVLPHIINLLQAELGGIVASLEWRLSPYHVLVMSESARDRVLVRETYEFAAAHRLHCPDLSEAENQRLFGKCNNPSGHGHNYHVETLVESRLDPVSGRLEPDLLVLERIVDETIVKRFDHKHLDRDTPEFSGINSSVENIARVCYDLLAEPIRAAGGELRAVTIWETEKTSCTYPAEHAYC